MINPRLSLALEVRAEAGDHAGRFFGLLFGGDGLGVFASRGLLFGTAGLCASGVLGVATVDLFADLGKYLVAPVGFCFGLADELCYAVAVFSLAR